MVKFKLLVWCSRSCRDTSSNSRDKLGAGKRWEERLTDAEITDPERSRCIARDKQGTHRETLRGFTE